MLDSFAPLIRFNRRKLLYISRGAIYYRLHNMIKINQYTSLFALEIVKKNYLRYYNVTTPQYSSLKLSLLSNLKISRFLFFNIFIRRCHISSLL